MAGRERAHAAGRVRVPGAGGADEPTHALARQGAQHLPGGRAGHLGGHGQRLLGRAVHSFGHGLGGVRPDPGGHRPDGLAAAGRARLHAVSQPRHVAGHRWVGAGVRQQPAIGQRSVTGIAGGARFRGRAFAQRGVDQAHRRRPAPAGDHHRRAAGRGAAVLVELGAQRWACRRTGQPACAVVDPLPGRGGNRHRLCPVLLRAARGVGQHGGTGDADDPGAGAAAGCLAQPRAGRRG